MEAMFNLHSRDFKGNTIEFDVKNPTFPSGISEEIWDWEYQTGTFTNQYGDKLLSELNYHWISDWSFAGRSGGWFVLITDRELHKIPDRTLIRMERIVEKYFRNYGSELSKFYSKNFTA